MSVSVGTLEKNVEKIFENLTPAEKAKYVTEEAWKIAEGRSMGINGDTHRSDVERFWHRHVLTMSAEDYIKFLVAEDKLNVDKWAGMYFYKVIWYQDLAIALNEQIISYIKLLKEITENPQRIKQPEKMVEIFDSEIKMIRVFQEDYRKDVAKMLKEVPWEDINRPPPQYPVFDLHGQDAHADRSEKAGTGHR
jgi:hypothetical protein